MYNPNYGAFQGGNMPPGFMPGVPPQQQPQTPQQQAQLSQQMMYNPQQYPPQAPYGAPPNGMPPNAMMQGNGMTHMGAAGMGMPGYQPPYNAGHYGASPGGPGPQQQNFMGGAPPNAFAMSPQSMTPQAQQQHRMQQRPTSTPTPQGAQRMSPFPGVQQGTPPQQQPHAGTPVQMPNQFSTPRTPTPHQNPQQSTGQQSQSQTGQVTPQTPNFPPGQNPGNTGTAPPLSPSEEAREKERVTILLEINSLLLMETLRLQASQKDGNAPEGTDKAGKNASAPAYRECLRRLQANLSYLVAITDRSHKPAAAIPAHPAIMSAPPLGEWAANSPSKAASASNSPSAKKEDIKTDTNGLPIGLNPNFEVPSDRDTQLKEYYTRLQALFPGVDPRKEGPQPGAPNMGRPPTLNKQGSQPNMQEMSQPPNMNANPALQNQFQQQMQQQANAMGMGRPQGMPNAAMMNANMQAMRAMNPGQMMPAGTLAPGMMPPQMGGMMPPGMAMSPQQAQQMPGQMMR